MINRSELENFVKRHTNYFSFVFFNASQLEHLNLLVNKLLEIIGAEFLPASGFINFSGLINKEHYLPGETYSQAVQRLGKDNQKAIYLIKCLDLSHEIEGLDDYKLLIDIISKVSADFSNEIRKEIPAQLIKIFNLVKLRLISIDLVNFKTSYFFANERVIKLIELGILDPNDAEILRTKCEIFKSPLVWNETESYPLEPSVFHFLKGHDLTQRIESITQTYKNSCDFLNSQTVIDLFKQGLLPPLSMVLDHHKYSQIHTYLQSFAGTFGTGNPKMLQAFKDKKFSFADMLEFTFNELCCVINGWITKDELAQMPQEIKEIIVNSNIRNLIQKNSFDLTMTELLYLPLNLLKCISVSANVIVTNPERYNELCSLSSEGLDYLLAHKRSDYSSWFEETDIQYAIEHFQVNMSKPQL